jgi:hypothetical protein
MIDGNKSGRNIVQPLSDDTPHWGSQMRPCLIEVRSITVTVEPCNKSEGAFHPARGQTSPRRSSFVAQWPTKPHGYKHVRRRTTNARDFATLTSPNTSQSVGPNLTTLSVLMLRASIVFANLHQKHAPQQLFGLNLDIEAVERPARARESSPKRRRCTSTTYKICAIRREENRYCDSS